jgi:hypothetical protein
VCRPSAHHGYALRLHSRGPIRFQPLRFDAALCTRGRCSLCGVRVTCHGVNGIKRRGCAPTWRMAKMKMRWAVGRTRSKNHL